MTEPVNPPPKKKRTGNYKGHKGWTVPTHEELEAVSEKFVNKGKDHHGRPTMYNEELGDEICTAIASHAYGLERICKKYPHFPDKSTIWEWRVVHPAFGEKYRLARLVQADIHAEECIDISDNTENDRIINKNGDEVTNNEAVNRSRLRVDTRKWIASKLLPKQYGDKQLVEDLQAENASLRQEMIEYRRMLDEKNKKDY